MVSLFKQRLTSLLKAPDISRFSRWLLVGGFSIPLMVFLIGGAFSRFIADDYCVADVVSSRNAWETYQYFYQTWSGRFSYYIVTNWFMRPSAAIYSLVPPLLVGLWFVALLWLTYLLVHDVMNWTRPVFWSLLLTCTLMYGILTGTPNLEQSIYWVTGAVTYVAPLVILTFYCVLTLRLILMEPRRLLFTAMLLSSSVLLFVSVGFSETTAVLQVFLLLTVCLLAVRYAPQAGRTRLLIWFGVGLICSLIALALVISAPGNEIRRAAFGPTLPTLDAIQRTIIFTLAFFAEDVAVFAPLPFLTVLFTATSIGYALKLPRRLGPFDRSSAWRGLILFWGFSVVIIAVCTAPSVYVMSVAPPARVYLIPHTFMMISVLGCGLLIGFRIRINDPAERLMRVPMYRLVLVVMLAGVLLTTTWSALLRANTYRLYAQEWDARDAEIRAAVANGATQMQVAALDHDLVFVTHLEDLSSDAANGLNRCAASYYHLESLGILNAP